jgi:hypothetical protein
LKLWKMNPIDRLRTSASLVSDSPGDLLPVEDVGPARRAIEHADRLSSVDLPQPDGPMIATNSPSWMSRSIAFSAVVSTASVR